MQELKFTANPVNCSKGKIFKATSKITSRSSPSPEKSDQVRNLIEKLKDASAKTVFDEFRQLCSSQTPQEIEIIIEQAFAAVPPEQAANFYIELKNRSKSLKFPSDNQGAIFLGLLKNEKAFNEIYKKHNEDNIYFHLKEDFTELAKKHPNKAAEVLFNFAVFSESLFHQEQLVPLFAKLFTQIPLNQGKSLLASFPPGRNYSLLMANIAMNSIQQICSDQEVFADRGISKLKYNFQPEILKEAMCNLKDKTSYFEVMRDYIIEVGGMLNNYFKRPTDKDYTDKASSEDSLKAVSEVFGSQKAFGELFKMVTIEEYIRGFDVVTEALYKSFIDVVKNEMLQINVSDYLKLITPELTKHNIFLLLFLIRLGKNDDDLNFFANVPMHHDFGLIFLKTPVDSKEKLLKLKVRKLKNFKDPSQINIFKDVFMSYIPLSDRHQWEPFFQ